MENKKAFTPAKGKIKNSRFLTGFTLIELLVVIAIIGLLATIVAVAVTSVRKKARDTKRRADLKELQLALELYADANGGYPVTTGRLECTGSWCGMCSYYNPLGTNTNSGSTGWIPNLAPTYLSQLPADPKPVGTGRCYLYAGNADDFKLLAYQTVENCTPAPSGTGILSSDAMYDPKPARSGECTLAVYTPGAQDW